MAGSVFVESSWRPNLESKFGSGWLEGRLEENPKWAGFEFCIVFELKIYRFGDFWANISMTASCLQLGLQFGLQHGLQHSSNLEST